MFKVILSYLAQDGREAASFEREIELPFAPGPGTELWFSDREDEAAFSIERVAFIVPLQAFCQATDMGAAEVAELGGLDRLAESLAAEGFRLASRVALEGGRGRGRHLRIAKPDEDEPG